MKAVFALSLWLAFSATAALAADVTVAVGRDPPVSSSILERASQLLAESSRLAAEGQRDAAVDAARAAAEGLKVAQASADADAAYLWLFTQALYTLTVRLIEAQRLDDAANAAHDAVSVGRQAAAAPGADVSAVASLMISLSAQLAGAGLHPEAVDAAQAAADELRGFQPPSDGQTAYLWQFTQALYTLTVRLIEAGRLSDAPAAAHETVQVALQAANAPEADATAVASLMLSLSAQLAGAGLHPGAVEAAQAAVDILRGEDARRAAWSAAISRTPTPQTKGCFNATYPKTGLQEVPCVEAPNHPYPPASGPPPANVGNGTDWTATVAGAPISSATGSFDTVSGVTLETGTTFGSGPNCPSPKRASPISFRSSSTQALHRVALRERAEPGGRDTGDGRGEPGNLPRLAAIHLFIHVQRRVHAVLAPELRRDARRQPRLPNGRELAAFGGGCYLNSTAAACPLKRSLNLRDMSLTASANTRASTP